MQCFVPKFEKRGGLVTVVTQDAATREVLMVAFANREAFFMTMRTRKAAYWSTSRNKLWIKGEESGNVQEVADVLIDCDGDAVIYLVRQTGGGACHAGARSCFFRSCIDARQVMDAPKSGKDEQLNVCPVDQPDMVSPDETTVPVPKRPLRFVLPTGSLSEAVRKHLGPAGYEIPQPDRKGYCGICNGVEFHQLDRRTIPEFLATGLYDAGITGRDLLIASGVQHLKEVSALCFSRSSSKPTRWVLAKRKGWQPDEGQEVVIGCELPYFAEEMLSGFNSDSWKGVRGLTYRVRPIYGSEEQCVRDGIVDLVLVVTETGTSLVANGLEIIGDYDSVFESMPVIVSRSGLDPAAEESLAALAIAMRSAVGAKQRVMVMCDLPRAVDVSALKLPSVIAPTMGTLTDDNWCSCSVCIPLGEQGKVLVQLEAAGARGIVVVAVQGYIA